MTMYHFSVLIYSCMRNGSTIDKFVFGSYEFLFEQATIKVLGCDDCKKIEITQFKVPIRARGLDIEDDEREEKNDSVRGTVNASKIDCNISRTKRTIYEYAICNPWELFFTGTLDSEKYDRTNLDKFRSDLSQFIRNYNRLNGTEIKYLLVPERHKDGKSWHIHGLIMGLPVSHLKQFRIGDKMGKQLADKVKHGAVLYNWKKYADKFGYCSLERVNNHEAVSKYIMKYITKEMMSSITELNKHCYYASHGLNKSKLVKQGVLNTELTFDWENDYIRRVTIPYTDELLDALKDCIDED